MSTLSVRPASFLDFGPVLVSELPPVTALRPTWWARLRENLALRRESRAFERESRLTGPNEYADLLVQRRRG